MTTAIQDGPLTPLLNAFAELVRLVRTGSTDRMIEFSLWADAPSSSGSTELDALADAWPFDGMDIEMIRIVGHAASSPSADESEYETGKARADQVRDYLLEHGIPNGDLGPTESLGASAPVAGNEDRVQLVFSIRATLDKATPPSKSDGSLPPGHSHHWSLALVSSAGASVSVLLAAAGASVYAGVLRNDRTDEKRAVLVAFGAVGLGFGPPVDVATAIPTRLDVAESLYTDFITAEAVTFDAFDNQPLLMEVAQASLIVAGQVTQSAGVLQFIDLPFAKFPGSNPSVFFSGLQLGNFVGATLMGGVGLMMVV